MAEKKDDVVVPISMSQLKELLAAMGQNNAEQAGRIAAEVIQKYKEEAAKPTESELEKRRRRRRDAKRDEETRKDTDRRKQASCTHIHSHNNKSRMAKAPVNVFPGAWIMMCSKCFYTLRNYEIVQVNKKDDDGFDYVDEKIQLISNPEFDHWWKVPTVAQSAGFHG